MILEYITSFYRDSKNYHPASINQEAMEEFKQLEQKVNKERDYYNML